MQAIRTTLSDRQAVWAFVIGCIAVTAGVAAHLPMFTVARSMHYRLAGMPVDNVMLAGMTLIVIGTLVAAYGLLPCNLAAHRAASTDIMIAAPEDTPLSPAHWG